MKYGVRKPSISKSVKAKTTGRVTRTVKRSVNPLYGKKGMGVIHDPKKSAYNKIYKNTTIGLWDNADTSNNIEIPRNIQESRSSGGSIRISTIVGLIFLIIGIILVGSYFVEELTLYSILRMLGGLFSGILGVTIIIIGRQI